MHLLFHVLCTYLVLYVNFRLGCPSCMPFAFILHFYLDWIYLLMGFTVIISINYLRSARDINKIIFFDGRVYADSLFFNFALVMPHVKKVSKLYVFLDVMPSAMKS